MGTGNTGKRLLLYRFTTIIKALYPSRQTHNPYPINQSALGQELDQEEQLLFSDLLHCLTVVNQLSRVNDKQRLSSTREDFLNALQLVLPQPLQLNPRSVAAYNKLSIAFKDKTFDYVLAGSKLQVSIKTVYRLLKPLIAHGLIEQLPNNGHGKAYFRVIEQDTSQPLFDTMQGQWKDFVGFEEL